MQKSKPILPNRSVTNFDIRKEYYHWLCYIIRVNHERNSYYLLAQTLHQKDYRWHVPNDDNRGEDGKSLREKFADDSGYNTYEALDGPCTMLEFLIALAERCEAIMADSGYGDEVSRWFWEMLENVKLDRFTDEEFEERGGTEAVNHILDKILSRYYKRNGQGGLFPLNYAEKDQRKVEIWYQMHTYLLENYYFEEENV